MKKKAILASLLILAILAPVIGVNALFMPAPQYSSEGVYPTYKPYAAYPIDIYAGLYAPFGAAPYSPYGPYAVNYYDVYQDAGLPFYGYANYYYTGNYPYYGYPVNDLYSYWTYYYPSVETVRGTEGEVVACFGEAAPILYNRFFNSIQDPVFQTTWSAAPMVPFAPCLF